jgi:hypothetical protein
MRLEEVALALGAEVAVAGESSRREITAAGAADLLSDVLYFGKPSMLLLTGLTEPSVVRAAQVMEISALVFVRGKRPGEEVIHLAREAGISVLISPHSMFDCCGRLYVRGLPGVILPAGQTAAG